MGRSCRQLLAELEHGALCALRRVHTHDTQIKDAAAWAGAWPDSENF